MPHKPLKRCTFPGCRTLVPGGKCAAHQAEVSRAADRFRGTPPERGYDSTWQQLRKMKLDANPICEMQNECKDLPVTRQLAVEVHHVIPIRERPDLRLEWTNLQSACKLCHSALTMRELNEARVKRKMEALAK